MFSSLRQGPHDATEAAGMAQAMKAMLEGGIVEQLCDVVRDYVVVCELGLTDLGENVNVANGGPFPDPRWLIHLLGDGDEVDLVLWGCFVV